MTWRVVSGDRFGSERVMRAGYLDVIPKWFVLAVLCPVGCRPAEPPTDVPEPVVHDVSAPASAAVLDFPERLYVDDASVNDFVRRAMTVCVAGAYDPFRLLWSATDEPISREQFELGWRAVRAIHVRGLRRVRTVAADAPAYALHAQVQLDATALAPEQDAERDVVLMCVWEHEAWRLAHAPKRIRKWLLAASREGAPDERHGPSPAGAPRGAEPPAHRVGRSAGDPPG